jgi:MFS family permease
MASPSLIPPSPELTHLAQIIQLAVAPVFLLAGIGAFLNVCAGRLARIVDRARNLEPRILASRGSEHDRLIAEVRMLDRRIRIVNYAIFTTVLAALIISSVVVLLFVAFLTGYQIGTAVALLFIAAMIFTALSFAIFLLETRLGTRSVRIRSHILDHEAEEEAAERTDG